MDNKCGKSLLSPMSCRREAFLPPSAEPVCLAQAPSNAHVETGSTTALGIGYVPDAHLGAGVVIPGYNVPALPLKPVRDPALSLIALSGVEPTESGKVEAALVQHSSNCAVPYTLAGTRVGFADRLVRGNDQEPIEHSASFLEALGFLRQAGAQLVAVPAERADDGLRFTLHSRNEIDERVSEYRLDALVSESHSAAFHAACWSGYPSLGEPLGDGATLWFYGAQWSKDSLKVLVQGYRNARGLTNG